MSLVLKILTGPQKSKEYPLNEGQIIGRENQDISLLDPRVSVQHAQVTLDANGLFLLKDLGSRNGIIVNGKKRALVPLELGTLLKIGKTKITVAEASKEKIKTWEERLSDVLLESHWSNQHDTLIYPLSAYIILEHLTGPQQGLRWILGYGPRKVGAEVHDLTLFEKKAPPICFEIVENKNGIELQTTFPDIVLVNSEKKISVSLKDKDII